MKAFDQFNGDEVIFISLENAPNSRTKTYFVGLVELGIECQWYEVRNKSIFRDISRIVKNLNMSRCKFVIASPSHVLVPYVFWVTRKMPIFDLGWPLFDGVITSRKNHGILKLNFLKTLVVDFFSIIFSRIVFVESSYQQNRLNKVFFFCKGKFALLPTGINESRFNNDFSEIRTISSKVILFRGGDLPEAGIDVLISAIRINTRPDIKFIIISRSNRLKSLNLPNTQVFTDFLPDNEIKRHYLSASIILGQLSSHKRTNWTIPHKFYEAAYLGIPYVTSNSSPMIAFESSKCVKLFKGGDAIDLIKTISLLVDNSQEMKNLSYNINNMYKTSFNQKLLSKVFLRYINKYK